MSKPGDELPVEIVERLLSFCTTDAAGHQQVADMKGLVAFVLKNAEKHPTLLNALTVDEDRLTRHIQETGEVPPGVKLVKTTTEDGSNVTRVQIVYGPGRVDTD